MHIMLNFTFVSVISLQFKKIVALIFYWSNFMEQTATDASSLVLFKHRLMIYLFKKNIIMLARSTHMTF